MYQIILFTGWFKLDKIFNFKQECMICNILALFVKLIICSVHKVGNKGEHTKIQLNWKQCQIWEGWFADKK